MTLRHLVIRELLKEVDETEVQIGEHGGLTDSQSAMAENLFEGLLSAFSRRSSLTHGAFDLETPEAYPFISAFEAYTSSDSAPQDFLELTDNGMAELARTLSDPAASAAGGGYIIFAQYGDEHYDYLLIALVRNREALALNDQLQPTRVEQINLDQLHQAARINMTSFRQGRDSYLSFIGSQKKDDITQYFSRAFGCTSVTPSRKSTGELIRAARDFCNEHQLYEQKDQVVEDVVSYLERQRGEKQSASLNEIDQVFDNYLPAETLEEKGTGSFSKFANGEPYEVSQEFQPHTSTINRLAKMKAKADNWQLDFSRKALGEMNSNKEIEFDEENQTITLRRLPTKVVKQIRELLEQQDA
ncbi:MAG: nucleoid-associated protein [Marinobacterium sp.]|nr:nucleoid-associated protein [Marinobacterium sp.]